jgi:hypothetical protein
MNVSTLSIDDGALLKSMTHHPALEFLGHEVREEAIDG